MRDQRLAYLDPACGPKPTCARALQSITTEPQSHRDGDSGSDRWAAPVNFASNTRPRRQRKCVEASSRTFSVALCLCDESFDRFCGSRCRAKFTADPPAYPRPQRAEVPPVASAGIICTWPMYPEIRRRGPGEARRH
jgi:hypothetical protein